MSFPGGIKGRDDNHHVKEQEICLECGFCCDGTLFSKAGLKKGERGSLPPWIEEKVFSLGGEEYFRLPCDYFSSRCTIYDRKKAFVCSAYRCKMLEDFSEGNITAEEALKAVGAAARMRSGIIELYKDLSGERRIICFRELLQGMGKISGDDPVRISQGVRYDLLLAQCNIFEALLIKHFRPAEDFEKMIAVG